MTSQLPIPTILIDSREQTPLVFSYPNIKAGLPTGDYSVAGLEDFFCIERKTLPDLYGSLTSGRDRFMRELQRMQAYPFRRLLIIGTESEISMGSSRAKGINPKSIIHSLYAIEARGVPVVFAPSPQAAASLIERWAYWLQREHLKIHSAISKKTIDGDKSHNSVILIDECFLTAYRTTSGLNPTKPESECRASWSE